MHSWKTFVVGIATAIFVALQPLISNGNFVFERDWKSLVGAALIAAFGYVAKDANVTGGNQSNGLTANKPIEPLTKDKPDEQN